MTTRLKMFAMSTAIAGTLALDGSVTLAQTQVFVPTVPSASSAARDTKPADPVIPLKVTVVISRFQGDKRTSNLPYTLWVNTGDRTNLRMNNNVAIPQSVVSGKGDLPTTAVPVSFSYQSVGTSIDCGATVQSDGSYRLDLSVTDSQVTFEPAPKPGTPATSRLDAPTIQSFSSITRMLLRDGQTAQYTTAVDKVSGEVIKVDVSVNVVK